MIDSNWQFALGKPVVQSTPTDKTIAERDTFCFVRLSSNSKDVLQEVNRSCDWFKLTKIFRRTFQRRFNTRKPGRAIKFLRWNVTLSPLSLNKLLPHQFCSGLSAKQDHFERKSLTISTHKINFQLTKSISTEKKIYPAQLQEHCLYHSHERHH